MHAQTTFEQEQYTYQDALNEVESKLIWTVARVYMAIGTLLSLFFALLITGIVIFGYIARHISFAVMSQVEAHYQKRASQQYARGSQFTGSWRARAYTGSSRGRGQTAYAAQQTYARAYEAREARQAHKRRHTGMIIDSSAQVIN